MYDNKYISFCKLFYYCTYMPLYYYKDDALIMQWPETKLDFISNFYQMLKKGDTSINYIISGEMTYYGIVKIKNTPEVIIVGPVGSTPSKPQIIRNIMKECSIPLDFEHEASEFFSCIPLSTFQQFLRVLCFINYEVNGEEIDILEFISIFHPMHKEHLSSLYAGGIYKAKEEQSFHNSYYFEKEFLKHVESGDIDALKKTLYKASSIKEGTMANSTLRQVKNIFVTAATLITRSAIAGGFDIEGAYQLSDIYITEMEKLLSPDSVYQLSYSMILDFTEHVAKTKVPGDISNEVYRCIQYASQNTNQPIKVSDVAKHMGKSRSYLARRFKQEMGFDLSAFIMRCKLEEARSLLAYTDKSIGEISNYLCFSSQSYFHNVFKKKYGLTPKQFRDKRQ